MTDHLRPQQPASTSPAYAPRVRRTVLGVAFAIGLGFGLGCAHHPPRFDVHARKTCLVLSAGGTRGVAQLGALRAIRETALPISCVVGSSVGALMGGLYASAPHLDTTERFRELTQRYRDDTLREADERGLGAGLVFGAVAAAMSGGVLAPVSAALGGYLFGASTVSAADRGRMERVLAEQVGHVQIEDLPVPFVTFHHERVEQGLRLVIDRDGDLAAAIGASIANPFVFTDVDVRRDRKLDPGSDRVVAVPVEDACRSFPASNLLVVNVTGTPALTSATMTCPVQELMLQVAGVPAERLLDEGDAFQVAWRAGYEQTRAALTPP